MPAVVGRSLDDARDKVLRGVVYADVKADRVIRDAEDLPKRPGGGKWKVGEVIAQTPAAKSTHATSTTAQLAVRLQYWAGEKGDRSHCSALRASLKKDDLDLALDTELPGLLDCTALCSCCGPQHRMARHTPTSATAQRKRCGHGRRNRRAGQT